MHRERERERETVRAKRSNEEGRGEERKSIAWTCRHVAINLT